MRKKNHILIFFLKLFVSILTFYFIYLKIKTDNLSNFQFPELNPYNFFLFALTFFLMLFNWLTEAFKWKLLIQKITSVKLITAFKAVFSGIPFALFTPARTGEIVGRVLSLDKKHRKKAVLYTALGSYAQMTITFTAGLAGSFILIFFYKNLLSSINPELISYLKFFSLLLFFFSILIFYNFNYVVKFLQKINVNENFLKPFKLLSHFSKKELSEVLLLSLARYFIFSFQFYLLLLLFGLHISPFEAFTGICLMYLLSSLIPVISILEIGVRGASAIIFLGLFSANYTGILSAVSVLWIINLAIPALTGLIIFNKFIQFP